MQVSSVKSFYPPLDLLNTFVFKYLLFPILDTDIEYQSFQTEPALTHTWLCKQLLQPLQVFANNHNEEETENNEVNGLKVFSSCRNILSFL